ncbi:IclR family transcriptional regulator [Comamonadaceae bacterium G21597-S1]|nr:IclR family transcriptional regulator [Comamonadaceae bacterium G21597-S1]
MKSMATLTSTAPARAHHAAAPEHADHAGKAGGEDRYLVPALQRGLQLLAEFSRNERELTGAELSRRLGLPRASVFRILQTLEQMGYVERVGESAHYKLGMAVLRLGFEFLASMELTELGRPVIDDLSAATGLAAHLVVRDGREVVFVAKSAGRSFIFNSIQVGARLPAHATVLGRVLLGDLSMDELATLYRGVALTPYTEQTPTTLAALKALIDEDARRGYGVSQGGFESAISTIAAPVYDHHHTVSAAVSVTVPAQQVDPQQLDELVAQVKLAAQRLSQHISHQPPTRHSASHPSKNSNP